MSKLNLGDSSRSQSRAERRVQPDVAVPLAESRSAAGRSEPSGSGVRPALRQAAREAARGASGQSLRSVRQTEVSPRESAEVRELRS